MAQDIHALEKELEQLRAQVAQLRFDQQQLNLVIDHTGVGTWDWDVTSGKTVFNERWASIIGYTLEELSPISIETWSQNTHPDDLAGSEAALQRHWAGETDYYIFECRMKHKEGHWVWVYDTGQVIEWEREGVPKRMIGTHLDITERKLAQIQLGKMNKKLRDLSFTDSLTNIANRRAYEQRLKCELLAAQRSKSTLSVLMIDIDYFKQFNDNYGHEKGNQALKRIAQIITNSLPRKTDFVARYGGEEIVVLLPYTPLVGAIMVAKRIVKAVYDGNIEHAFSKFDKRMTISVGIASTDTGFDSLIDHADQALYHAKRAGRNQYGLYVDQSLQHQQKTFAS